MLTKERSRPVKSLNKNFSESSFRTCLETKPHLRLYSGERQFSGSFYTFKNQRKKRKKGYMASIGDKEERRRQRGKSLELGKKKNGVIYILFLHWWAQDS